MNHRLQSIVYGLVFALIVGWVLYIGQGIFVPIIFSVLLAYVIFGLTRLLERIPGLGPALPLALRYAVSVLAIGVLLFGFALLFISQIGAVVARAPEYLGDLLALIQQGAVALGMESEPTWASLRRDALSYINLQRLLGSTALLLTSLVAGLVVVVLYVAFMLVERAALPAKIDNLSSDPAQVARVRQLLTGINTRIGAYLALKTLINIITGLVTWAILALFGVEFAAFWAVLAATLNYIPYIGTVLSVAFPVLFAMLQFADPGPVMSVLIALSVAQFFTGHFLDPYVMGQSLNLSPLVILVSLAVWATLWGIPGAFLAVPMTACLVMILSEFPGTRPIAVLLSRHGKV
ncbi:AI-2E family transporter [Luteimonas cucumeris]|nr:AI-2E family transporter [Luteimonas cucumeris]